MGLSDVILLLSVVVPTLCGGLLFIGLCFVCGTLCHFKFAIISLRKKTLLVVIVVWLLLAVPWVCLQFLIAVFLDHTRLPCLLVLLYFCCVYPKKY